MSKMKEKIIIENITISSPDKVVYPKVGITKKDIATYYQKIGKRMLPYVKDRIISSVRCPAGTGKNCFYKKHLEANSRGLKKIIIPTKNGAKTATKNDYYYITNILGIISEVQMNTIEFHVWGSTVSKINKPDIMVFDLDPDESLNLEDVRTGVKDLKSILDKLGIISFLKTSGGKGYHVVVPFKATCSWAKFRAFAKNIAELMETTWPDKYVSNMRKTLRQGKIYIDWVRNTKSQTSIAPYSLRAREYPTVSMPIKWSELDKVAPNGIHIKEAIARLKRKNPWEDFFDINQELK